VLSVKQEIVATLFLTGLESILTKPADKKLAEKSANNKLTPFGTTWCHLMVLKIM